MSGANFLIDAAIIVFVNLVALGAQWHYRQLLKTLFSKSSVARKYGLKVAAAESTYSANGGLIELTLDHLSQGLVMVDPAGNVLVFNKRALEYTNVDTNQFTYPPKVKEILEAQWRDGEFGVNGNLLPDEVRQFFLTGKGSIPKSYVRRRPNGTVLEVRSEPLPDGGIVQTYTDITELVRAKEAAEAGARAKSQFLATMSHEIRTPLNGVLGTATLLRESPLTPRQTEYVKVILESGDVLMNVINDILDFSKFDAGMVDIEAAPFALAPILRSTVELLQPQAQAKGLSLILKDAEDLPSFVLGDSKRLRQILLNLIGNALKFTDHGSVTLDITRSAAGEKLRFAVTDTGIGIPPEAQNRLFKEFSQIDASINRRFGGTGLGLAISQKIVASMGGTIHVESTVGAGSCFWFEIPAHACEAPALERPPVAAKQATGNLRVLLVEDMPVNQLVAKGMLEALNHSVDVAQDGLQALEQVQRRRYDVVMMDMQMPRMNGLDATRAIRALGGVYLELPIIAMTANIFESDKRACLAAGMNDVVGKPLKPAQIDDALRRAVSQTSSSPSDAAPQEIDVERILLLVAHVGADGLGEVFDGFADDSVQNLSALETALLHRETDAAVKLLRSMGSAMADLGLKSGVRLCADAQETLAQREAAPDLLVEDLSHAIRSGLHQGRLAFAAA